MALIFRVQGYFQLEYLVSAQPNYYDVQTPKILMKLRVHHLSEFDRLSEYFEKVFDHWQFPVLWRLSEIFEGVECYSIVSNELEVELEGDMDEVKEGYGRFLDIVLSEPFNFKIETSAEMEASRKKLSSRLGIDLQIVDVYEDLRRLFESGKYMKPQDYDLPMDVDLNKEYLEQELYEEDDAVRMQDLDQCSGGRTSGYFEIPKI